MSIWQKIKGFMGGLVGGVGISIILIPARIVRGLVDLNAAMIGEACGAYAAACCLTLGAWPVGLAIVGAGLGAVRGVYGIFEAAYFGTKAGGFVKGMQVGTTVLVKVFVAKGSDEERVENEILDSCKPKLPIAVSAAPATVVELSVANTNSVSDSDTPKQKINTEKAITGETPVSILVDYYQRKQTLPTNTNAETEKKDAGLNSQTVHTPRKKAVL